VAIMNDAEKYIFDLNGYIVLRGVFSAEEVAAANEAIDKHSDAVLARQGVLRNTAKGTVLGGDGASPRKDLGGMLSWEDGDSAFFRSVLAHSKLVPYLNELLGKGYRMDHQPFCILQDKGSEGFALHGGRPIYIHIYNSFEPRFLSNQHPPNILTTSFQNRHD
jgi:hypothetical protein